MTTALEQLLSGALPGEIQFSQNGGDSIEGSDFENEQANDEHLPDTADN